jgi:hypothetical protein
MKAFGANLNRQYRAQAATSTNTVNDWKISYRKWKSIVITTG